MSRCALTTKRHRRGVTLVLVVLTTSLVGGFLTLLAISSARLYRDRQVDLVRALARAATDSAVAYARAHSADWAETPPDKPIELDIQELLPAKATGSATLRFLTRETRRVCRVSVDVRLHAFVASDEVDVEIR